MDRHQAIDARKLSKSLTTPVGICFAPWWDVQRSHGLLVALACVLATGCVSEPDVSESDVVGQWGAQNGKADGAAAAYSELAQQLVRHVNAISISFKTGDARTSVYENDTGLLEVPANAWMRVSRYNSFAKLTRVEFSPALEFTVNIIGRPVMEIDWIEWDCNKAEFTLGTDNIFGGLGEYLLNAATEGKLPPQFTDCTEFLPSTGAGLGQILGHPLFKNIRSPSISVRGTLPDKTWKLAELKGKPINLVSLSSDREDAELNIAFDGPLAALTLKYVDFRTGLGKIHVQVADSMLKAINLERFRITTDDSGLRVAVGYAMVLNLAAPSDGHQTVFDIDHDGAVTVVSDDVGVDNLVRSTVNKVVADSLGMLPALITNHDDVIPGYSLEAVLAL
jgi:hypothetical protein